MSTPTTANAWNRPTSWLPWSASNHETTGRYRATWNGVVLAETDDAVAMTVADPYARSAEAIQFFTRPGCGFSASLRRRLRRLDVAVEYHDIWKDPAAAAFVRSVARGNETVPTLVVGDVVLVAPAMRQLIAATEAHAPQLLPPGAPAGRSSRLARLFTGRGRSQSG
jgi:mycoredoxin